MTIIEYYEINAKEPTCCEVDAELITAIGTDLMMKCLYKTNCYNGWRYNDCGQLEGAGGQLIVNVVKDTGHVLNEVAHGILYHLGYGIIRENVGYKWNEVDPTFVLKVQNFIKTESPYESRNRLNEKIEDMIIHNFNHQKLPIEELMEKIKKEYNDQIRMNILRH